MIDFYCFPTPNSFKIALMLEECGIAYRRILVDITRGEQFSSAFLDVNPNNKVPAIIDHNGPKGPLTLFESGAILLYLAEKTGRFLSVDLRKRYNAMQWLFWQMAGLGPMAGQALHFLHYAQEQVPYAVDRYIHETQRLYTVLDKQLERREWLADDYSIADMACWGWVQMHDRYKIDISKYPHVAHWLEIINKRPAAIKAMTLNEAQGLADSNAAHAGGVGSLS